MYPVRKLTSLPNEIEETFKRWQTETGWQFAWIGGGVDAIGELVSFRYVVVILGRSKVEIQVVVPRWWMSEA